MAVRRIPVLPTNEVVDLLYRNVRNAHSGDLQDTAECHICNEPFLTGCEPERPVILRCGHIMGEGCILKWMSPLSGNESQNSCPLCRKPLLYSRPRTVQPTPTMQPTQSGDSERSRPWYQVWDELCHPFQIDLRSTCHRAWHQFCFDLERLYDVASLIILPYAAVLLFLFCLNIMPLPAPTFVLDWSRTNLTGFTGRLGFRPTQTYP